MTATLRIFTYREGLLSRLGHDLQLTFDRFRIEAEERKLLARFEVASVRVVGAMKNGKLDEAGLSESDRRKIESTILTEVLLAKRFPEAVAEAALEGVGKRGEVRGTLLLAGRRLALPLIEATSIDDQFVGSVRVEPSRWGIKPYRAMAGALKLKDFVDVELALPLDTLNVTTKRSWAVDTPRP